MVTSGISRAVKEARAEAKPKEEKPSGIRTLAVFLCILMPSLCMWIYLFPGFLQPDHATTIALLVTGKLDAWHSVFWALLAKPLLYDLPSYGFYGLAQVLLYVVSITFFIAKLRQLGVIKSVGTWVLTAVFALSPCYLLYNVTYSSDMVFAILLVPYTAMLVELAVTNLESLKRTSFLVGLSILTFVLLELRKNALLIPLILFIVLLIMRKDLWKRILVGVLVPVVAFFGINAVFNAVFDVRKSPSQEMMSVPAQQIGRVYAANLPVPEDLNGYFISIRSADDWKRQYHEDEADTEKQGLKLSAQFVGNWVRLGMKYPTVYAAAYWDLMKNYFMVGSKPTVGLDFSAFPNFTEDACKAKCKPEYVQQMTAPLNQHQEGVLRWFAVMSGSKWLTMTVQRVFFNTATPFWCLLAVFAVIMLRKKYKRMLVAVVPMACLFIAFLCFSPIVLTRYAMEMYYMIPVLMAAAVGRGKISDSVSDSESRLH
jgi:hypothetical protein